MKEKALLFSLLFAAFGTHGFATNRYETTSDDSKDQKEVNEKKRSRFTVGGYGEAVYSRNFYSDNYMRYLDESKVNAHSNENTDVSTCRMWLFSSATTSGKDGRWEAKSSLSMGEPKAPSK